MEDQVKGMMVAHIINGDMEPYWSQYGILRGTTGLHLDMEPLTMTVWMPPPTQFLIQPVVQPREEDMVEDQVKGMMVALVIDDHMEPYWCQYGPLRSTTGHWSPSGHGAVDHDPLDATTQPNP